MTNNSKSFTLRIPNDLRKLLEKKALREGRTLSNLIVKILKEGLKDEKM